MSPIKLDLFFQIDELEKHNPPPVSLDHRLPWPRKSITNESGEASLQLDKLMMELDLRSPANVNAWTNITGLSEGGRCYDLIRTFVGPSEWAYGKAMCKVRESVANVRSIWVPKRGGILHHAPGRSFEAWHSRPGSRVQEEPILEPNALQVMSCWVWVWDVWDDLMPRPPRPARGQDGG